MPHQQGIKPVAQNKKAYHDYIIEEEIEAGIVLSGTEIKSIRLGKVSLQDSYRYFKHNELFIIGMHISPYEKGNIFNHDSDASRKLLVHKKESQINMRNRVFFFKLFRFESPGRTLNFAVV